MNVDQIDKKLKELSSTCSIDQAKSLVDSLVALLGVNETKNKELLTHTSIDREVTRFVKAPMVRNQAAAYTIPHESGEPIDLKLFWVKNTTKANLSWLVALTPNFEDDTDNNENANIGIDFVLSESCDRLYIILSYKLKLRVLELHKTLSHTQKEILENWIKIRNDLDPTSETYKEQLRSHLWKSFDFEPVNKYFYSKLIEQFDHLVGHLKGTIPEEEAKMFAVKLFGRSLFLWFLKKKEFLNPKINYFEVKGEDDQTRYYQNFLEPLFFEVLNSEIRGRKYPDDITPFLNGGLFEPTNTDFHKDASLTFPDGFFTQFYALLNRFNFTVDEGTSDYEQVAIDPEMLGRVFENLLASINPDTAENARTANGAFYTHREIVDYMCEQSLIEYLKASLPESSVRDQRIEELVTMNESDFREQDHNKRRDWKRDLGKEAVIKALDELRVLDPAVGSGAFPMGMLQLLVKVYSRIETANEKDLAGLKRDILSRSLYGVDIDQMAIQISRLRAWLSILVDMQDLRKVEPLPNLDFKFVCANTLIPLAEGTQDNLFDEYQLKEELVDIREKYYEATKKTEKKMLREQYLAKIHDGGLFAALESERQKQLKDYNPFNSLNSSGFYDPSLMHGVSNFSVIIGNPPYILEDDNKSAFEDLHSHPCYQGKTDIWHLFTCTAINYSSDKGIISYIAKNQWLESYSASKMRGQMYTKTSIKWIVNFGANLMFDNVGQQTMMFLLQRSDHHDVHNIDYKKCLANFSRDEIKGLRQSNESSDKLFCVRKTIPKVYDPEKNLTFSESSLESLLDKVESQHNFSVEDSELVQGIIGGPDAAFTFNQAEYESADDFLKVYLKELHTNTKRYRTPGSDKYLAYVHRGNFADKEFEVSETLKEKLLPYKAKLENRREVKNGRLKWFHLWWPRDESFFISGPKLAWAKRTEGRRFTYTEEPLYGTANLFFLKTNRVNLKYLTALLNSKLIDFYMHHRLKHTGDLLQVDKNQFKKIPINAPEDYKHIDKLVDEILKLKKQNDDLETLKLEIEIDELVMDLYSLTPEEKEIIRNS